MAKEKASIPHNILMNVWFIKNNSPKTTQAIKEFAPLLWTKIMKELRDFESENQ